MVFESCDDIFEIELKLARPNRNRFEIGAEEFPAIFSAHFGGFSNLHANAGKGFEQPLLLKGGHGFLHGARIDLITPTQLAHGWKGIPRAQIASENRLLSRVNDLFPDRDTALEF